MVKTVNMVKAPSIELVFTDGKKLLAVYNMDAVTNFQNKMDELKEAQEKNSISETNAIILWAGVNAVDERFSYEEAREIVSMMDVATISEFTMAYYEGVAMNNVDAQKKTNRLLAQTIVP